MKNIDSLTVNDIRPIAVSFKRNNDELALYKWILKHSCYSSFIKDTLKTIMENEKAISVEPREEPKVLNSAVTQENNLIDLNF